MARGEYEAVESNFGSGMKLGEGEREAASIVKVHETTVRVPLSRL